jgi:hypothetical protein
MAEQLTAADVLEGKKVKERTVSAAFQIKINTGNYETVDLNCSRSITVEGDLTDEEQKIIHKDLFLDCVEDVIKQWNFTEKQFNRRASTGMPKKLAEKPQSASSKIAMEDVVAEE